MVYILSTAEELLVPRETLAVKQITLFSDTYVVEVDEVHTVESHWVIAYRDTAAGVGHPLCQRVSAGRSMSGRWGLI